MTPTTRDKIISHLEQSGPISLTDLETALPEPDTYRSLLYLKQDGIVTRKNGKYGLTENEVFEGVSQHIKEHLNK